VSAAARQRTCAACGGRFRAGERTNIEVVLDGMVRYVAVHPGHSTFPPRRPVVDTRKAA
jgi:transcriptional regulator NrdR family protein